MKSKLLVGLLFLVMSLSGVAFAENDDTHNKMNSGQMMPGMMPDMEKLGDIQKRMTNMQSTMEKIQNTKNEKERQELMDQHMQEMNEGMGIMQSMMMGKMNDMNMQHEGKGDMTGTKDMMMRENMMDQRLDMMQSMMGQMMNHMMEGKPMGMDEK